MSLPRGVDASNGAIIGESPELIAAMALAREVAEMDIPVLILGETGTGKELLASYIHGHSERPGHLVDVDCGAIPEDLIESLLFGHVRGAFTGAVKHARGLLAEADGGSLLLDELANLPLMGQSKLLRVLETGEVRRVGGRRSRSVDFRIIATAQGSLAARVRSGHFRADLLQRVAGVVIELPNLAARVHDIALLADHFAGRRDLRVTQDAKDFLSDQEWPGNVRQLKWTITRGVLFERGDGWIDRKAVESALQTGPRLILRDPDSGRGDSGVGPASLLAVCRQFEGDPDLIARALGIGRSTLYRRLKEEGLALRRFRSGAEAG